MKQRHISIDTRARRACRGVARAVLACMAALLALSSYAVTDKEMEQARTIAAQAYLRYANDGSGYLDDHHPTSMAELQKVLKAKEKENIKAFMAVTVPKDYASWDKAKLVEYWSVTAFKAPGLTEKGKAGRTRAKSRIQAMKVSAPAPAKAEPAPAPVEAAPAAEPKKEEAETPKAVEAAPVEAAPAAPADSAGAKMAAEIESVGEEIARTAEAEAELEDVSVPKKDNTWIYIVILCVLVGVVVALVIFASSTMKRRGESEATPEERDRRMREREAERTAVRAEVDKHRSDNAALKSELAEAQAQNENLRKDLDEARKEAMRWRTETTALRERVRTLEDTLESLSAAAAVADSGAVREVVEAETVAEPAAHAEPVVAEVKATETLAPVMSKIYLGRVNARGIFVRADRGLNLEGSVYVLETEDGFSGSYRVVRNREVWKRLLSNPEHWLEGGCIIRDPGDLDPASIGTESAGTAVFEGSCWRVIRKARIRYE